MDSLHTEVCEEVTKNIAFNSIEWILEWHSMVDGVVVYYFLSIPLNGFTSYHPDVLEAVWGGLTFNSIEWIHRLVLGSKAHTPTGPFQFH